VVTEYDAVTYGDRMAGVYDKWFAVPSDTEDPVELLSDLAGAGPVLELGIGTGRVALPLAQRGHEVRGVDASEVMVERLRAKPGGEGSHGSSSGIPAARALGRLEPGAVFGIERKHVSIYEH
jgi:SAM-dependent methyltransferase